MNREDWLNAVAQGLAPIFAAAGTPLPERFRAAIGFPSTGRDSNVVGECWDACVSADRHYEVFIRPDLADAVGYAAILAHELVHAAVGLDAGHGPVFRGLAVAIGLDGPMRATVAGPRFRELIQPVLDRVGPLPHARLGGGYRDRADLPRTSRPPRRGPKAGPPRSSRPPRQGTRLLKCVCPVCGYTVRVTQKWLDVGPPHCPRHGAMAVVDAPADSGW